MALQWSDVDLGGGVLRVERSWDPRAREIVGVKTRAGRRRVPIPAVLRDHLVDHKLRVGRSDGLVFGGVNAKALSVYLGHSSIGVTFDLYGHLMPGNEDEAAGLLDGYLARADTAARLAQLGG
jgi:integrase